MLVEMSNAQVEESLVAFWNFDDGAGKTAKDNSENKLDGELVGGPKWVEGKVGKALSLMVATIMLRYLIFQLPLS